MVRRKETVEILNESIIRHRPSFDFVVRQLPASDDDGVSVRHVPITLLRKEPGRFTRFDFKDEGGRGMELLEAGMTDAEPTAVRWLGQPVARR